MFSNLKTPVGQVQSLSNRTGRIRYRIHPDNLSQTIFVINHIAVSMFRHIRAALISVFYYYEY